MKLKQRAGRKHKKQKASFPKEQGEIMQTYLDLY